MDPGTGQGAFTLLSSCLSYCSLPSWTCNGDGTCSNPGNGLGYYGSKAICETFCVPIVSTGDPNPWNCIVNETSCIENKGSTNPNYPGPMTGSLGTYPTQAQCNTACGGTLLGGCAEIAYSLTGDEVCVTFSDLLNASLQIGDKLYFSLPEVVQSGINHPFDSINTKSVLLGIITNIIYWDNDAQQSLVCVQFPLATTVETLSQCNDDVYYFFSKDNEANLTSLIGYYAEVEIRNNSLTEAEMFSITTDFSESSR